MTMRLQEFFPYDSTIVGLESLYNETPDGYFINSSCVLSEFNIIKPNQVFTLQSFEEGVHDGIKIVQLLEVFYIKGQVYLYVIDLLTQNTKIISHCLTNGYLSCDWKLIEINFLMELLKNGYEFTIQPTESDLDSEIV